LYSVLVVRNFLLLMLTLPLAFFLGSILMSVWKCWQGVASLRLLISMTLMFISYLLISTHVGALCWEHTVFPSTDCHKWYWSAFNSCLSSNCFYWMVITTNYLAYALKWGLVISLIRQLLEHWSALGQRCLKQCNNCVNGHHSLLQFEIQNTKLEMWTKKSIPHLDLPIESILHQNIQLTINFRS